MKLKASSAPRHVGNGRPSLVQEMNDTHPSFQTDTKTHFETLGTRVMTDIEADTEQQLSRDGTWVAWIWLLDWMGEISNTRSRARYRTPHQLHSTMRQRLVCLVPDGRRLVSHRRFPGSK